MSYNFSSFLVDKKQSLKMALQVKGTHGNLPSPCDVVEGGVGFPQQGHSGWEVGKKPRVLWFWGFAGSLSRSIALCEPISGEKMGKAWK